MLDSGGTTSYNEYDGVVEEVFSPSVDQKCLHVFYHVSAVSAALGRVSRQQ